MRAIRPLLLGIVLMALAPLSWGKVRLTCNGTMEDKALWPSHGAESDDQIEVVLRNKLRPYSAKIVGGRSLPMEISDDKERYVGKEGSSDQGDYISLSIHRVTLEIELATRSGLSEEVFTGQCEWIEDPWESYFYPNDFKI